MAILSAAYLGEVISAIFVALGAPSSVAKTVSNSLVEANLMGHDSHGVIRVIDYLKKIADGKINPQAEPEIVRETATTLLVDGHWGFGQVVADWTMERVIERAAERNLAAAGILHCGHVGRVGAYPAKAARRGFIGFAFVNGGGVHPVVVPFGGKRPVFDTNPLAAAVPIESRDPLVLDFATSVVASGKIRIASLEGEEIPEGWIIDREGQATRRPEDYYNGGMLLPAAGHKGYALGLLVEILGGLLTGAGAPILPESGYQVGNGVFFLVLNIAAFRPLAEFTAQVHKLGETIKLTPPTVKGGEVLLPGEPEQKAREHRLTDGIHISDKTWEKIVQEARDLGLKV